MPYFWLTLSLSILLPSSGEQDVNLYRYRQEWLAATTQHQRDSISAEVLASISDYSVDHAHGQEQTVLWDECCIQWEVTPLESAQQAPYIKDVKDVRMHTAGSVEFVEAPSGFSDTRDSFFLASNRYPGYGGMDIFFRENKWFGNLGRKQWLAPRNLGKGLNTASDEYAFQREGDAYVFVRVVDGHPMWFRAESRDLVERIELRNTCPLTTYIIANINSCRGYLIASIAFDSHLPVDLPPGAHEIVLRCCPGAPPRTFERCNVTERTLLLEDTDVRVHRCAIAGATTSGASDDRFGFSVYEAAASGERAVRFLKDEILAAVTTEDVVQIAQIPGHLEAPLKDLAAAVVATGARVDWVGAARKRTTVQITRSP